VAPGRMTRVNNINEIKKIMETLSRIYPFLRRNHKIENRKREKERESQAEGKNRPYTECIKHYSGKGNYRLRPGPESKYILF